jgi:hypothetical protein
MTLLKQKGKWKKSPSQRQKDSKAVMFRGTTCTRSETDSENQKVKSRNINVNNRFKF